MTNTPEPLSCPTCKNVKGLCECVEAEWEKEVRGIISGVCCDGTFVDDSITFIRTLIDFSKFQERERLIRVVEKVTGLTDTPAQSTWARAREEMKQEILVAMKNEQSEV